jgi:hypothetical protein
MCEWNGANVWVYRSKLLSLSHPELLQLIDNCFHLTLLLRTQLKLGFLHPKALIQLPQPSLALDKLTVLFSDGGVIPHDRFSGLCQEAIYL